MKAKASENTADQAPGHTSSKATATATGKPPVNPSGETPAITVEQFEQLLETHHPFSTVLKVDILEIGHGTALLRLPEDKSHQRLGGMIAGPMLMGLADLALYAAVVGATGNPEAVTASLTMNFMRKSPPGGVLARATILKTGRLAAGEVLLTPVQGGAPVAQAISTWALPPRRAQDGA